MKTENDFVEFIKLLNGYDVDYAIVGAYAVAYHSIPRATRDLDILVRPTRENGEKVMRVLNEFGFGSLDVSINDFTDENMVIQLGIAPVRIDVMSSITGISVDTIMKHKVHAQYRDQIAWFISLDDLILNKKSTGRAKDAVDVEILEQFKKASLTK